MKKNQSGFTLIEVMVSAALLGGLVLATMSVTQLQSRSTLGVNQNSQFQALISAMQSVLDTAITCGGGDTTPMGPGHTMKSVSMLKTGLAVQDPVTAGPTVNLDAFVIQPTSGAQVLACNNAKPCPAGSIYGNIVVNTMQLAMRLGALTNMSLPVPGPTEPYPNGATGFPRYDFRYLQLTVSAQPQNQPGVGFTQGQTAVLPVTGLFDQATHRMVYCFNRDLSLNSNQVCANSGEIFGRTPAPLDTFGYCGPGPSPTTTTVKQSN